MDEYIISDVTKQAKALSTELGDSAVPPPVRWKQERILYANRFSSYPEGSGSERLGVFELGIIFIGDEQIDLRGLHDIITSRQLDAIGFMLRMLEISNDDRVVKIQAKIDALYEQIEREGMDCVYSPFFTTCRRFLDLPRKCDLLAVVHRMRKLRWNAKERPKK